MTQSNPRLGCGGLLWDNRRHLEATTEQSGYEVENIADWTANRYWKPTFVSNPPATERIFIYPLDVEGRIEITNWFFKDWSNGPSSAPDGWTLVGSGATVARNASTRKIGAYSVSITRSGTDCYLEIEIPDWEDYVGLEITVGVHVEALVANRGRVGIDDGITQTYSSYQSGSSAFDEWLYVTHEVAYNATTVKLRMQVDSGDTTVSFDGIACYVGDTISQTPHAQSVSAMAYFDHNLGSANLTAKAYYTSDSDPGPSSTWTEHLSVSPTNDRAVWKDGASQSGKAWMLEVSGTTGSRSAAISVGWLGPYVELPFPFGDGWNPYDRTLGTRTRRSRRGLPIQRDILRRPIPLNFVMPPGIEESDITGAFATMLEHNHDKENGRALPFFLQWDDAGHESQTFYCWLDDGAEFSAGLGRGFVAENLSLSDFMAANE